MRYYKHNSIIQIGATAVKAFVWGKMDEKINLLVRYFFNDAVSVNSVNSDPANAYPSAWLSIGPLQRNQQTQGLVKGEGQRSERAISQIIRQDL